MKHKLVSIVAGLLLAITLTIPVCMFTGCGTLSFYDSVITVTEVGDSIRAEYGRLYRLGLISPEQDKKATAADEKYREALNVLATTLEVAKVTGDQTTVPEKLRIVKLSLVPLMDLIFPLLSPDKAETLTVNLNRAVATK